MKNFIQHYFFSKKKDRAGFSLVEMIVAIGIFTAVMFIAIGALLSIVGLNKKAQAQQSAINNLNFALENMARSIRTGSSYRCEDFWTGVQYIFDTPLDCPNNGGGVLVFKSDQGVIPGVDTGQWGFWLEGTTIKKGTDLGASNKSSQITADEIYIEGLKFYVVGASDTSPNLQPRVRINVSGYAFVGDDQTGNPRRVDFDLQTTASQRILGI